MDIFKSLVVILPVINEIDNLKHVIPRIKAVSKNISILIVDDDSSDGTADFISFAQKKFKYINYIYRPQQKGIGSAHVEGLRYSILNNFNYCITMDADQTHDPKYIVDIFEVLVKTDIDLVLTSRFIYGGGVSKWPFHRKILTYLGHLLTFLFIRSSMDITSGMRGYKTDTIPLIMLDELEKSYYEFFPLSYLFYEKLGRLMVEIPITLPNRGFGSSKNNLNLIFRNIRKIIFSRKYIFNLKLDK